MCARLVLLRSKDLRLACSSSSISELPLTSNGEDEEAPAKLNAGMDLGALTYVPKESRDSLVPLRVGETEAEAEVTRCVTWDWGLSASGGSGVDGADMERIWDMALENEGEPE